MYSPLHDFTSKNLALMQYMENLEGTIFAAKCYLKERGGNCNTIFSFVVLSIYDFFIITDKA